MQHFGNRKMDGKKKIWGNWFSKPKIHKNLGHPFQKRHGRNHQNQWKNDARQNKRKMHPGDE